MSLCPRHFHWLASSTTLVRTSHISRPVRSVVIRETFFLYNGPGLRYLCHTDTFLACIVSNRNFGGERGPRFESFQHYYSTSRLSLFTLVLFKPLFHYVGSQWWYYWRRIVYWQTDRFFHCSQICYGTSCPALARTLAIFDLRSSDIWPRFVIWQVTHKQPN